MLISIVIPALEEAEALRSLLPALSQSATDPDQVEWIIADAYGQEQTHAIAESMGARVIICGCANRAYQLNKGAKAAKGTILYFLHADVWPPNGFDQAIRHAINEGYEAGSFRLAFDDSHWLLRLSAWFTRFAITAVRFGDQSLFVKTSTFWRNGNGGFQTRLRLMEDQEMVKTLKGLTPFRVIPSPVIASARRYRKNGIFRQQANYFLVYLLYQLGVSQNRLIRLLR